MPAYFLPLIFQLCTTSSATDPAASSMLQLGPPPDLQMAFPPQVAQDHADDRDACIALGTCSPKEGRWTGTGTQIGAGLVGGIGGGLCGLLVGAAVGSILTQKDASQSSDPDKDPPLISNQLGGILVLSGLGGIAGVAVGTGATVHWAGRTLPYASQGMGFPVLGSVLGLVLGAAGGAEFTGSGWGALAGGLGGSALGATLLDRSFGASPGSFSIAPWTPEGRAGAMAVAAF